MTLEEKGPYAAGTKPSSLGKYGPSAVRDVEYVDLGGNGRPIVAVKQRKNGQYVVVEKIPLKNRKGQHKFKTVEQSLAESGVKFRTIRPRWKEPSRSLNYEEDYHPNRLANVPELPSINLGWKADARIGSLDNAKHQPSGGDLQIFNEKQAWRSNAKSKVGSLDNVDYNRARTSQSDPTLSKNDFSIKYGAKADVGYSSSFYTPGEILLTPRNQNYDLAKSRIGSLDNVSHKPGGGDVVIPNHRNVWKQESRIGSLNNVSHKPGGGDIYIVNQRLTWKSKAKVGSLENSDHNPVKHSGKVPHYSLEWKSPAKVGSLDNIHYTPRGGNFVIPSRKLKWRSEAKVKCKPPRLNSLDDLSFSSDDDSFRQ